MSVLVILLPVFIYAGATAFLLAYVLVLRMRRPHRVGAVGSQDEPTHVRVAPD
ncbi:MAG TPA: hypothetical protein VFH52_10060 [Rhodanobacteraceae bacterium]|nr:hypothetical protein [Rhodanobacteraceae bacterium]